VSNSRTASHRPSPPRRVGSYGTHARHGDPAQHAALLERIKDEVWRQVENPACLPEIRDVKKKAYTLALAQVGTKVQAARIAGVHPCTPYSSQWRNDQPLQLAVKAAAEAAADLIEAEAFRRGVEGSVEPVGWYQGKPGGYVRRYSDVLSIFLLKGLRPDRYKDRVQLQGALANLDLNQLPDEAIERIAKGEHIMSVLASMVPRAGEALPGLLAPPGAEMDLRRRPIICATDRPFAGHGSHVPSCGVVEPFMATWRTVGRITAVRHAGQHHLESWRRSIEVDMYPFSPRVRLTRGRRNQPRRNGGTGSCVLRKRIGSNIPRQPTRNTGLE
jgi:hypothetical protein